jgi:methionine synthase I (cobalamin-dependent)
VTTPAIMQRFAEGRLLFDGGLGSQLIAQGLETGWPPDEWNLSRPDVVRDVHRAYADAGAEVITTNTFGATPGRLATHGFSEQTREINAAGVRLAREAIAGRPGRFVGFSIGPGGEMMPPVGTATEALARAEYEAQVGSLDPGDLPDIILIETMIDLREALIALDVAKATGLPVSVALTYNKNPRGYFTVMGNEAEDSTAQLEAAGADVIAANCSVASGDMLGLARLLRKSTALPVLCQPNAGTPGIRDGKPVYDQAPEEFCAHALELYDMGVNAVGGCCGTTPGFIGLVAEHRGAGRE